MTGAQFSQLKRGDIVRSGKGTYRRCLSVKHWPPYRPCYPPRASVHFKILRKSWTGRDYTVYTRSDLLTNRYRYIGSRGEHSKP